MENKFEILFEFAKKSLEEVLIELTKQKIESSELLEIESDHKLSIVIGLAGETNGRILIETSLESAKNLALLMNAGKKLKTEEDFYMYMSVFANKFCEYASKYMQKKFGKKEVWLAPPAIFSAKDLLVITPHVTLNKACHSCDLGQFIVDIGFSEGEVYGHF